MIEKDIFKKIDFYKEPWKEIKERVLEIWKRIQDSKEIEALLNGLDGGYIPAGPSGLITKGRVDVLPTGRNFFSLDPHKVPTQAAYMVGKNLAEKLLEKYLEDEGRYPENVAIFWMANDIMWADGEGMAQIMHLIGVRPIWLSNGRIKGFEVIPLPELGRPRIDVTIRASGIIRDNFPMCIELLDEAIQTVANLDEPPELNYIRKHTLEIMKKLKVDFREGTLRVFCAMPGTYQAGTQLAVYASAWKEEKDLAEVFIYWNGFAYGKNIWGEAKHKTFTEILKSVEITYNKVVTDEYDLLGCCCYFGTHGGLTVATKHLSGREVKSYYGDTRDLSQVEVRTLAEEIERVARTKLLNPKWIEGMKKHGYKGAGDISKRVGRLYGWQATTKEVSEWIFDEIARTFLMNEENRQFFRDHNPWALEEIGRRLLEAWQRGLWNPADDVRDNLKKLYLEVEGWIEGEIEGEATEIQGGRIDIISSEEVSHWRERLKEVLR